MLTQITRRSPAARLSHLHSSLHTAAAWAEAGPLATDHILFDGGGLDEGVHSPKLALVLHGLLGQGKNLRTFTTELFQRVSQTSGATWTAVLVDLRCHGKSQGPQFAPPHTLQAAAGDIIATLQRNWPQGQLDVLIGHSLGGKVALEVTRQLAAAESGELPPRSVWALDSMPGPQPDPVAGTSAEVLRVLEMMDRVPLPISSREWLYEYLNSQGHKKFQQWVGSNLKLALKNEHEYEWMFDIPAAFELFKSYRKESYWDLLRNPPLHPFSTELHVVKAMKGGRWDGQLGKELAASVASSQGRTHVHEMAAGHWLHSEDPKGLAALMAPHIARLK